MNTTPVIVGIGGQCALGLNWPAMSAAVRAGISASAVLEYLPSCQDGHALTVNRLMTLPARASLFDRMKSMAIAAAREALVPWLAGLERRGRTDLELPILLSIPPERPAFGKGSGKRLAQQVVEAMPVAFDRARCSVTSSGHEAGLAALTYAAEQIAERKAIAFLVGGVDSYLDIELLHSIERQGRLKSDGQPHGFIPGEGAGFVLVCSRELADWLAVAVIAEIVSGGRGHEPRCWWGSEPTLGQGLTSAFRATLQASKLPAPRVQASYSDVNGETWRAEEWGYAYVRTGKHHASPLDHRHPASFWGDVGAASGPLLVGLAAQDLRRDFEPGALALVWTASDSQPYRSACLIRQGGAPG